MLQNVHRIEKDVTYVTLTRGKEAIINTADVKHVLQVRWYAELIPRNGDCYARGRINGESVLMHRYILGAKGDEWVDHINFNTLDNRRENLRIVTSSENRLHQRRKVGKSGMQHIAVTQRTDGRQYYFVTMMRNGVRKSKGYPCTPEGLQSAQELVILWQEDFSYEPPRTVQRRAQRSNLITNNTNRDGASSTSKTGIRGVSTHKCKPSGLMYVFKCSCVTCKACKYFPYTEEGLEAARLFAESHYAAMKKN